jgi:hypothetical protein
MPDPAAPVPGAADPERRARLRRELLIFAVVGGFGLVVLPFLVYFAGAATLGPYEGGLGTFLGKLYGDLIRLTPSALALLLGPYVMFQAARMLTRPLRQAWTSGKART